MVFGILNFDMTTEITTLVNFVNKYGYCIARTFNDTGNHTLWFSVGENFTPDCQNFSWSCFCSAQFLNLLFDFNEKEDLHLQTAKSYFQSDKADILTFDAFIKEFVPGRAFFFEVDEHEFHIFYFNENEIYIADYFAEMGRDNFKFTPVKKCDVIRFVEDPKFRESFLCTPYNPDTNDLLTNPRIDICDVRIHIIKTIPSLKDILRVIKNSQNIDLMVEMVKQEGNDEEAVIMFLNKNMEWLENYVASV